MQVGVLPGVLFLSADHRRGLEVQPAEGPLPVAISAPDLALSNLGLEDAQCASAAGELNDIPALGTDVVELEDGNSRVTAIEATGLGKQVPQIDHVAPLAWGIIATVIELVRVHTP